jgi:Tfp pilus assembly protein PilN
VGLLLGGLGLAGMYWVWKGRVEEKTEEVRVAQQEVDALAEVIKEVEEFKAKKAELERKIGIINDLKANQRGPVRIMDYISRALPELLWLDRLKMDNDSIEIEGRAFNTNAVAAFIENLDKVPEFDEPILKSTEEQTGGVYKFVVNFNYSFASKAKPAEGEEGEGASPAPSDPATSG